MKSLQEAEFAETAAELRHDIADLRAYALGSPSAYERRLRDDPSLKRMTPVEREMFISCAVARAPWWAA